MQILKFGLAASLGLALGACSLNPVQPWEKNYLARPDMQLAGSAVEMGLEDHIYFSKEGSSGGRSFAGGGCGCN